MPTLIGRRAVLGALAAPFLAGSAEARPPFRLLKDPQPLLSPPILDEAGTTRKLDDFAGRVMLLNIWATWCPPCREEMPTLDRLQSRLGGAARAPWEQGIDPLPLELVDQVVGAAGLQIVADALATVDAPDAAELRR